MDLRTAALWGRTQNACAHLLYRELIHPDSGVSRPNSLLGLLVRFEVDLRIEELCWLHELIDGSDVDEDLLYPADPIRNGTILVSIRPLLVGEHALQAEYVLELFQLQVFLVGCLVYGLERLVRGR